MDDWQPIETAPKKGKFLIATYAPTNWAYWVSTVVLYGDIPREREIKLKYARYWREMLPEPQEKDREKISSTVKSSADGL